jgi:hypothetical protein
VLLDSDTASSSASITLTGLSGSAYVAHRIVLQNVTLSQDASITLRTGNGSIDTGNNYIFTTLFGIDNAAGSQTSAATSSIAIATDVEATSNNFACEIEFSPGVAINRAFVRTQHNYIRNDTKHVAYTVAGYYNGGVDRVQLIPSAGNFATGTFKVYGLI